MAGDRENTKRIQVLWGEHITGGCFHEASDVALDVYFNGTNGSQYINVRYRRNIRVDIYCDSNYEVTAEPIGSTNTITKIDAKTFTYYASDDTSGDGVKFTAVPQVSWKFTNKDGVKHAGSTIKFIDKNGTETIINKLK